MTIWTRIRFLLGIMFVILLVGLLVLYLNNAMSSVRALRAELGADTTTVGVDYPGVITSQYVNAGDKVAKGETLFVVNSPQLTTNLANRTVTLDSLPFSLDAAGDILVKANSGGVIEAVNYQNGAYVPGGVVMATIDSNNSLYISGHFNLSPPDYARLKKGNIMDVTFPDNSKTEATVYNIELTQNGDTVDTVVKARLHAQYANNFRFPVGTPVEASLKLTNRTWWQDVIQFFDRLFKPTGR